MTPTRAALIDRLARILYAAAVSGAPPSALLAIEHADGLSGTALDEARRMAAFAYELTGAALRAPRA